MLQKQSTSELEFFFEETGFRFFYFLCFYTTGSREKNFLVISAATLSSQLWERIVSAICLSFQKEYDQSALFQQEQDTMNWYQIQSSLIC